MNDAPYDGCKINPKSGKTIKFERQKDKKTSNLNQIYNHDKSSTNSFATQQNGSNTHTQTSLYFFRLVESVYGIISTNICYFFVCFLFRFMFLLNESKKCEDPEIHQKHWEGQNWPNTRLLYLQARICYSILPNCANVFCSCLNVM